MFVFLYNSGRTVVAVATITDDERVLDLPQGLKIAALRFTETCPTPSFELDYYGSGN